MTKPFHVRYFRIFFNIFFPIFSIIFNPKNVWLSKPIDWLSKPIDRPKLEYYCMNQWSRPTSFIQFLNFVWGVISQRRRTASLLSSQRFLYLKFHFYFVFQTRISNLVQLPLCFFFSSSSSLMDRYLAIQGFVTTLVFSPFPCDSETYLSPSANFTKFYAAALINHMNFDLLSFFFFFARFSLQFCFQVHKFCVYLILGFCQVYIYDLELAFSLYDPLS